MPAADHTLTHRQKLIVSGVTALIALLAALLAGSFIYGATARTYQRIDGDEAVLATTTSLGRALSSMRDLHYFCTEGKSERQGVRFFACSGPEGWAEIEGTAAGKVTYLALVGRDQEMTDERAMAVGRVLVNGAELSQDAKIAARSITDGRADNSTGPWGTATTGTPPYRLIFEGSDRAKRDKPATLGAASTLETRLSKQSCRTADKASPSPSGNQPTTATSPSATPSAPGAAAKTTVTTCTSSGRFVTTTVTYEKSGEQVSKVSVRSSALFAYGWVHTEAISALRAALSDLGQDSVAIGDWVAQNSGRQGTAAVGRTLVELNSEAARAVTSVSVTPVP